MASAPLLISSGGKILSLHQEVRDARRLPVGAGMNIGTRCLTLGGPVRTRTTPLMSGPILSALGESAWAAFVLWRPGARRGRDARTAPTANPPQCPSRTAGAIRSMLPSSEAANPSLQRGLHGQRPLSVTSHLTIRGKPVAQPVHALSGRPATCHAGANVLASVPFRLRVVPDPRLCGRVRAAWRPGRAHESIPARGGDAGADARRLRRM